MRLALAALLLSAPAAAVEWTPLYGVTALAGQHSFRGKTGSFSGLLDAVLAPAARLDDSWALLPSWRSTYEGVRSFDENLGAPVSAQERMSHRLGLRAVYGAPGSRWRLKPSASLKLELLKETRDERWGRGLFDRRVLTVGGEVEYLLLEPASVRVAADFFDARYPNYTSLESQAAAAFAGDGLARELAGDRVLDRRGWQFLAAGTAPLGPRATLDLSAGTVLSRFGRQRVVVETGLLSGGARTDLLTTVAASARMPHSLNLDLRVLGALDLSAAVLRSDQNGYDAARGRFIAQHYDFEELRVAPSAKILIGRPRSPVAVSVGIALKRRRYPHRPPQDAAGAYGGGAVSQTEWTFDGGVDYPVAPRFSLVLRLSRASASSNTRFERFYRYSYEAFNALAGFRWEY
ncbi:MAG: hypothetical protein SF051_10065 [Elusimicrobiota bacterium]|nr:hypothetical protein [Elusimicrobiota bacterium]